MTTAAETISASIPGQTTTLKTLTRYLLELGATKVASVPTDKIVVEQNLADMCRNPRCEFYGLSTSCPPHVAGPAGFQKVLKNFSRAIFFKIDVPSELLFSSDRREVFQLLHELASGIERKAVKMGFPRARAYAGGSCKQIFCCDYPDCRVLSENGTCRNPEYARPSMSGFGINVADLIKTAGWKEDLITQAAKPVSSRMASVYGLVLIS